MPQSPDFLNTLTALLDRIEAALLRQDAQTVQTLCAQLLQTLQAQQTQSTAHSPPDASPDNRARAAALDQRLALLKKALLQQGAATERALLQLLPERALGAYGEKTGFDQAARPPTRQSYQA